MYYEEKWIDGRLFWRGSPKSDWIEFSNEKYAKRIIGREKEILSLKEDIRILHKIIEDKCKTN